MGATRVTSKLRTLFNMLFPDNMELNIELVIEDQTTGAGYIRSKNDIIFARWSTYHEGIHIIQRYIDNERCN